MILLICGISYIIGLIVFLFFWKALHYRSAYAEMLDREEEARYWKERSNNG